MSPVTQQLIDDGLISVSKTLTNIPEWVPTVSHNDLHIKISSLMSVLADRERELMMMKGPCSWKHRGCRLHYAHTGPCDIV